MPDRTPADVSAARVIAAGAEAMERRVARDWLTKPDSRQILREIAAELAARPAVNGFTSNAWAAVRDALDDPDLEEDHGNR